MKLRNPFSKATRELFVGKIRCIWCKLPGWDVLHHIMGRVSDSPCNASPIHNLKCHIGNGSLDSFENRSKFLKDTRDFLDSIGYDYTEKDRDFMDKYENYYNYYDGGNSGSI